jgi:hypothetical protein
VFFRGENRAIADRIGVAPEVTGVDPDKYATTALREIAIGAVKAQQPAAKRHNLTPRYAGWPSVWTSEPGTVIPAQSLWAKSGPIGARETRNHRQIRHFGRVPAGSDRVNPQLPAEEQTERESGPPHAFASRQLEALAAGRSEGPPHRADFRHGSLPKPQGKPVRIIAKATGCSGSHTSTVASCLISDTGRRRDGCDKTTVSALTGQCAFDRDAYYRKEVGRRALKVKAR